jgi:hypothetical protein
VVELAPVAHLPEKIRVEPGGEPLGVGEHRDGDGSAKRSSTLAALIFMRLPDAVST